jgi:hypothetical protein
MMKIRNVAKSIAVTAAITITAVSSIKAQLMLTTTDACYDNNSQSSNPSTSEIASDLGITTAELGGLLFDTDGGGSGATLNGSYSTSGINTYPVYITYNSGTTVAAATYLVVKDGNSGYFIWNMGSTGTGALNWNGTETLEIPSDLFPPKGNGDISHIEFFGFNAPTPAPVPEASTIIAGLLMLLPLGIGTVRALRKERVMAKI